MLSRPRPPGEEFRLAPDPDAAHATAERRCVEVAGRLAKLVPSGCELRHVGATAIPGCLTRGDIDLMVRVEPADFAEIDAMFETIFARTTPLAEAGDYSAFVDHSGDPPVDIQLVARGGHLDVFDRFCTDLAANPALLREYNHLKRDFVGSPLEEYRAAKDRFVKRVVRLR